MVRYQVPLFLQLGRQGMFAETAKLSEVLLENVFPQRAGRITDIWGPRWPREKMTERIVLKDVFAVRLGQGILSEENDAEEELLQIVFFLLKEFGLKLHDGGAGQSPDIYLDDAAADSLRLEFVEGQRTKCWFDLLPKFSEARVREEEQRIRDQKQQERQTEKIINPPPAPTQKPLNASDLLPKRPPPRFSSETVVGKAFQPSLRRKLQAAKLFTLGHIAQCTKREFLERLAIRRPQQSLEDVGEALEKAGLAFQPEDPTEPDQPTKPPEGGEQNMRHSKAPEGQTPFGRHLSAPLVAKLHKAGICSLEQLAAYSIGDYLNKLNVDSRGATRSINAVRRALSEVGLLLKGDTAENVATCLGVEANQLQRLHHLNDTAENVTPARPTPRPAVSSVLKDGLVHEVTPIPTGRRINIGQPVNGGSKQLTLEAVVELLGMVMENAVRATAHIDMGSATLDVTLESKSESVPANAPS